jgi:hypothetical protein
LKERIRACGDLTRLEIVYPQLDTCEASLVDVGIVDGSELMNTKVETLALETDKLEIFQTIRSASIDLRNIELDIYEEIDHDELKSIVSFVEEHYQDKLRQLVVYNEPLIKLLKECNRLKLEKLNTYFDLDEQCMCDFIRSQPGITHLEVTCISSYNTMEYALRNLHLLTVLELTYHYLDDISALSENAHHLRTLTNLILHFDNNRESAGCDISFIANIPNLQKFNCSFCHPPQFVKLAPIKNPMLLMKEFYFNCSSVELDEEFMWNIFHKMPNLEKITLYEGTAKVWNIPMCIAKMKIIK